MLLLGGLAGEGADDVVGLKTLRFEDGNAEGLKRAADVGNLAAQVFRHGGAIGLVTLIAHFVEALRFAVPLAQRLHGAGALIAEDLSAYVEDGGKVARLEILAQLLDHVHKNKDGRRGQARAGAHGARALHRMIGAEDERHGVEEEDGRLGLVCHGSSLAGGIEQGTGNRKQGTARNAGPSTPLRSAQDDTFVVRHLRRWIAVQHQARNMQSP